MIGGILILNIIGLITLPLKGLTFGSLNPDSIPSTNPPAAATKITIAIAAIYCPGEYVIFVVTNILDAFLEMFCILISFNVKESIKHSRLS